MRWGIPVLLCLLTAWSATASSSPQLRLRAGVHTGRITALDVDGAGNYLVTASMDKTARVWARNPPRCVGELRPPIGPGSVGELFAATITSDARRVAVGGATAQNTVYVFDRVTRSVLLRSPPLPASVLALGYAADGRRLAACLQRGQGLRVLSDAGRILSADTDFSGGCYGVEFDYTGRLAAASVDGVVRR